MPGLTLDPLDGGGLSINIQGNRATIGRTAGVDHIVNDPSVSRKHAMFECRDGTWTVTDVGSVNGTYVDHRKITSEDVRDGQEITFGRIGFRVRIDWTDAPTAYMHADAVTNVVTNVAELPTSAPVRSAPPPEAVEEAGMGEPTVPMGMRRPERIPRPVAPPEPEPEPEPEPVAVVEPEPEPVPEPEPEPVVVAKPQPVVSKPKRPAPPPPRPRQVVVYESAPPIVDPDGWTPEEMLELAKRQSQILWMVLFALLSATVPLVGIIIAPVFVYFTYKLAMAYRSRYRWVYVVLTFIPGIGGLAMLQLVTSATKPLKAHGIRVGLMGARSKDLDALRARIADGDSGPLVSTDAPAAKKSSTGGKTKSSIGALVGLLFFLAVAIRNLMPVVSESDRQLTPMQYFRITFKPTRSGDYTFEVSPTGGATIIGCSAPGAFPAQVVFAASRIQGLPTSTNVAAGAKGAVSGSARSGEAFDCVAGNPSSTANVSVHMKFTLRSW